jgi:hypothetical protein
VSSATTSRVPHRPPSGFEEGGVIANQLWDKWSGLSFPARRRPGCIGKTNPCNETLACRPVKMNGRRVSRVVRASEDPIVFHYILVRPESIRPLVMYLAVATGNTRLSKVRIGEGSKDELGMERITAVSLCGHVVVVWLLLHRTRESLSRFKIAAGRQHVKLDTRWLKAEAESFFIWLL